MQIDKKCPKLMLIIICMFIHLFIVASISFAANITVVESNGSATRTNNFVTLSKTSGTGNDPTYFTFKIDETGLYRVNAIQSLIYNDTNSLVKYRLDRQTVMQLSPDKFNFTNVSLASEKEGDTVKLANTGNDAYSKSGIINWGLPADGAVYVILDKDSIYRVSIQEDLAGKIAMVYIDKKPEKSGAIYGFAHNFPSAWVTLREKDLSIGSNDPVLNKYLRMDVSSKVVNETIENLGIKEVTGKDHAFWWLESILIYIIFAVGNVLVSIFETALGVKGLTLDSVIFNKMSTDNMTMDLRPTIDLRGLRRHWKCYRGRCGSSRCLPKCSSNYNYWCNFQWIKNNSFGYLYNSITIHWF